jgi:uncharacterized membrane protein
MDETFFYLTFIFILGSVGGWILELFFRKIVHKKWINPGFLSGPYLPIYGLGLITLYLVAIIDFNIETYLFELTIKIILVGSLMTLIEYIAGKVFIKFMGIKLWDYSKNYGNIDGVICPLFSFIWTMVGVIYLIFFHSLLMSAISLISTNIYYPFIVGIFFGLFLWDLGASLEISTKIKKLAEGKLVIRYEDFKLKERNYYSDNKIKYNFMKPLRNNSNLMEDIFKKYNEE